MKNKNIPASIQSRLKEKARSTNRPFQEMLEHFAMERFLYRLSVSKHRDAFILKGALLLRTNDAPIARPTRDIDFLGRTNNTQEHILNLVQEICTTDFFQEDGLIYKNFKAETIREDADYDGVRVRLWAFSGKVKIPMQIDVGFGDIMIPGAQAISYPTLLSLPRAHILGYPIESVIAEKLEAIVKLGIINSRMKDFYDLWLLSRRFDFDGRTLSQAILTTFKHRATAIELNPAGLSTEFCEKNVRQWQAFITRTRLERLEFQEVISAINVFMRPLLDSIQQQKIFDYRWHAPGPWR